MGPRAARERAASVTADLSYEFAFGTYEDALRLVGTRTEPRYANTAVSGARIQHFASMVRDPNPSYWDADFAKSVWGGLVAPPALLIGLLMPPPWVPNGRAAHGLHRGAGASPRHRNHQRVQRSRVSDAGVGGRHAERGRGGGVGVAGEEDPTRHRTLHRDSGDLRRRDGAVVAKCTNTLFRFTPTGHNDVGRRHGSGRNFPRLSTRSATNVWS